MNEKNQSNEKKTENEPKNSANETDEKKSNTETENSSSGDPGRTPGSAEGDEETIDEDIRQKEAEGKL